MKKYVFVAIALYSSAAVHAQATIGISCGYTSSELYTNIANLDYVAYRKGHGFSIGIPIQYHLNSWAAIQAEPGYMRKSYIYEQSGLTESPTHLTFRNNYLQLPFLGRFSFGGKKLKAFVDIGLWAAWWASGYVKGNEPDVANPVSVTSNYNYNYQWMPQDVDASYEFNSRRDRRLQAGWLAGAGISCLIKKGLNAFIQYRYYQDLTDQQKAYMSHQVPRYNLTSTCSAGLLLALGAKR